MHLGDRKFMSLRLALDHWSGRGGSARLWVGPSMPPV